MQGVCFEVEDSLFPLQHESSFFSNTSGCSCFATFAFSSEDVYHVGLENRTIPFKRFK